MKPVILSFVLLLAVLLGFAWMNGKFGNTAFVAKKSLDEKSLYFDPALILEVGMEGDVNLMANYSGAPVTGFKIEFVYDPTVADVTGILLNKDVFDTLVEGSVDKNFGKVKLEATSNLAAGTVKSGVQKLATIKMLGLKKGGMIITGGRRPEVTIWEGGELIEGDFQMQGFKVSVK